MKNTLKPLRNLFVCSIAFLIGSLNGATLNLKHGLEVKTNSHVSIENSDGMDVIHATAKKGHPIYVSLDVQDSRFIRGQQPNLQLSFEVLDRGKEPLTVKVDSSDPLYGSTKVPGSWKGIGGFQFKDTGKWEKVSITMKDAYLNDRLNGADFRFRIHRVPHLKLRKLELKASKPVGSSAKTSLKQGDQPNVLFIVFDDLNDYIGSYGDVNAKTPNLDRFAKESLTFNQAYCQYPVCGPSRASFLSGLYPENSGVLNNTKHLRVIRPDAKNILEYYKEQGYWVSSAGKIFHGDSNITEGGVSTHQSDWFINAENVSRRYLDRCFEQETGPIKKNKEEWKQYQYKNRFFGERVVGAVATQLQDEEHMDGRVMKRITSDLRKKAYGNAPFFMACGFTKPHVPFYAPQKYFDLYPLEDLIFEDVPKDDWSNKPKTAKYNRHKGFGIDFGVSNRQKRAKWLQAYLACISFVDAQLGKVLDELERNGLQDNTIVVVTSDHGFHIGEHFQYGKVTLFQESTRVPLMIRTPKMKTAGQSSESFAELLDLYPTLTDLCGLPAPKHLQGESLVPVLKDPLEVVRDSAYTVVTRAEHPGMVAKCLHMGPWRYTEWKGPEDAELYHLKNDPDEHVNLINNPEYAKVVKQLRSKLDGRHL